jgi:hypothetical protein
MRDAEGGDDPGHVDPSLRQRRAANSRPKSAGRQAANDVGQRLPAQPAQALLLD